nr:MAG TPA: hypothetical protein [Caudoviricetes sp.]
MLRGAFFMPNLTNRKNSYMVSLCSRRNKK